MMQEGSEDTDGVDGLRGDIGGEGEAGLMLLVLAFCSTIVSFVRAGAEFRGDMTLE